MTLLGESSQLGSRNKPFIMFDRQIGTACASLDSYLITRNHGRSMTIRFSTFPRTKPPPPWAEQIVDVFQRHQS